MRKLLEDRTAVIYGGGGAIGAAVARAFAREGAWVFLAGRTLERLDEVAARIAAAGGRAETDRVDALDEEAVTRHADAVATRTGGIDVALNAVGAAHVQGVPLGELSLEDYSYPVAFYTRANFVTAKAVARHMGKNARPVGSPPAGEVSAAPPAGDRTGVILTLSTPVSRMPGPGFLGHSVACAGVEALTRHLAGELAPFGVRAVCIRAHAIPEATARSHSGRIFRAVAERAGLSTEELLAGAAAGTLLKRLPTLDEVAETAVFVASGQAGSMTGAVVNLTGGFVLD